MRHGVAYNPPRVSPPPKWPRPTVYCVGWCVKLYSLTHSLLCFHYHCSSSIASW